MFIYKSPVFLFFFYSRLVVTGYKSAFDLLFPKIRSGVAIQVCIVLAYLMLVSIKMKKKNVSLDDRYKLILSYN